MKTAILFTGTSYNFKHSIDSLMQNFAEPNDADVFILTSMLNMRRRTVAGTIPLAENADEWHLKSVQIERDERSLTWVDVELIRKTLGNRLKGLWFIEDMPEYQSYLLGQRFDMMELVNDFRAKNNPAPFGSDVNDPDNGNVTCIVNQYNHVQKCFELMKEYEIAHGRYDYVVRARLDFVCPFEFNISHYYLGQDYPYLYLCGSYGVDDFEWADEFCFWARRDIAEKLFMNMHKMGFITDKKERNTISNNNEFLFSPETQFALLLHLLELKVLNVKIYRSAKFTYGGDGYDYMNYMFRRDIDLEHEYKMVCRGPSDINEHLPILKEYAQKCDHVTELGTRYGNSTIAFMMESYNTLITYDVQHNSKIDYLQLIADENGIDYKCIIKNPQSIEETDLLFIDTDHHVDQCSKELALHADKVRKYLIFHDVVSFWEKGQGYEKGGGLKYAIEPFMRDHPEWKQVYRAENNNGLLILERC